MKLHSFTNKCFLSTFHVLGTVLVAVVTAVNKEFDLVAETAI